MTPIQTYSRLRARLRDTHGFMLAEQLVSIIFIGLLSIAVAAGLTAALTAYSNITRQTNADNLLARAVESVSDELAYATDVEGDGVQTDKNPLYFTSATRHAVALLQSDERGIWLNAGGGAQFILVPTKDSLKPELGSLSYQVDKKDRGTWTFHVQIWSGNNVLAETDMQVKRIGS